jgi:hypothetical protein
VITETNPKRKLQSATYNDQCPMPWWQSEEMFFSVPPAPPATPRWRLGRGLEFTNTPAFPIANRNDLWAMRIRCQVPAADVLLLGRYQLPGQLRHHLEVGASCS